MPTLLREPHFVLELHIASNYVHLRRTALAFDTPVEAASALDRCNVALKDVPVRRMGILLDWRLSPLSTNARLHEAIVEHTDRFAMSFARRALLVVTPVGQMQLGRVVRAHSETKPILFSDEKSAIDYVIHG